MSIHLSNNSDQLSKTIVNIAAVPQRSLFRYPGGKTWFVPTARKWLLSQARTPDLLIEPFAGGGIIGLTAAFENLAKKVLFVELDPHVASVWKILIHGDYQKLAQRISSFEFSHETVLQELSQNPRSTDDHAFQTILRNRVSYGGIIAPGAGMIKSGEKAKGISSRWYPVTLAKRILNIGSIRNKISFMEGDAFPVIENYFDHKNISYFIDPPYTASGKKAGKRLYLHHNIDHRRLFKMFQNSKCDFLFTYNSSEELMIMAYEKDFQSKLISMKNTHHNLMTELVMGRDLAWLS